MKPQPVTPLVPARTGGVQFFTDHDYDAWTDAAAVGDLDPEGLPAYRLPGRSFKASPPHIAASTADSLPAVLPGLPRGNGSPGSSGSARHAPPPRGVRTEPSS